MLQSISSQVYPSSISPGVLDPRLLFFMSPSRCSHVYICSDPSIYVYLYIRYHRIAPGYNHLNPVYGNFYSRPKASMDIVIIMFKYHYHG